MDERTESVLVVSAEAASLPIDFRDELDEHHGTSKLRRYMITD
jgi:hypothetical protein